MNSFIDDKKKKAGKYNDSLHKSEHGEINLHDKRLKPKMAGNSSFKKHNNLRFYRTRYRKELGKKNGL